MNTLCSSEYLTTEEVAKALGRSVSAIQKQRRAGIGVPFIYLGKNKHCRYKKKDVKAYLNRNEGYIRIDPYTVKINGDTYRKEK